MQIQKLQIVSTAEYKKLDFHKSNEKHIYIYSTKILWKFWLEMIAIMNVINAMALIKRHAIRKAQWHEKLGKD